MAQPQPLPNLQRSKDHHLGDQEACDGELERQPSSAGLTHSGSRSQQNGDRSQRGEGRKDVTVAGRAPVTVGKGIADGVSKQHPSHRQHDEGQATLGHELTLASRLDPRPSA